jgi:hypothetical protein
MSDIPEKQVKRLRALIQEAETSLAAATELLVSLVGEDPLVTAVAREESTGKISKASLTAKTWLVVTAKPIRYRPTTHQSPS